MNKVFTFIGSVGLLAGLTQVGYSQLGQLALANPPNYGGLGLYGVAGSDIYAGTFSMVFTPQGGTESAPFMTYCTDLNVDIVSPFGANMLTTASYIPEPPSGTVNALYQGLYGGTLAQDDQIVGGELAYIADVYGQSGTAAGNASAQIAIWDIAQGGYGSATDGFFNSAQVTAWGYAPSVISTAELDAAGAFNGGGKVGGTLNEQFATDTWYQADPAEGNQDFLTPNGTPEPFTMGIGAAGIGLALLRRVKRST